MQIRPGAPPGFEPTIGSPEPALEGRLDDPERSDLEARRLLREARVFRERFGRYVDLSGVPDALIERVFLSPQLYNPTRRRFEFQRTPNIFPTGRVALGAASTVTTALDALTAFGGVVPAGGPFDNDPIDARVWKLLGGTIWASAQANVLIRPDGGRRAFGGAVFAAAGVQTFTVPGNGGEITTSVKRSLEIVVSTAAAGGVNVDVILFVAEEPREEMVRSRVGASGPSIFG